MNRQELIAEGVGNGDYSLVAKAISSIENNDPAITSLLDQLKPGATPVLGFTGPPGAGKSTLIAAIIGTLVEQGKRVAILSVDPSSVVHKGALLGDRIRMKEWYLHPMVYIRSLASRGHLGGLTITIASITQLLQSIGFDYVLLETVGVGQSEVQVASVASVTALVLVPESGDEIQMMKSGLFEVADLFVVNKMDREGAAKFAQHIRQAIMDNNAMDTYKTVVETVAINGQGVAACMQALMRIFDLKTATKK